MRTDRLHPCTVGLLGALCSLRQNLQATGSDLVVRTGGLHSTLGELLQQLPAASIIAEEEVEHRSGAWPPAFPSVAELQLTLRKTSCLVAGGCRPFRQPCLIRRGCGCGRPACSRTSHTAATSATLRACAGRPSRRWKLQRACPACPPASSPGSCRLRRSCGSCCQRRTPQPCTLRSVICSCPCLPAIPTEAGLWHLLHAWAGWLLRGQVLAAASGVSEAWPPEGPLPIAQRLATGGEAAALPALRAYLSCRRARTGTGSSSGRCSLLFAVCWHAHCSSPVANPMHAEHSKALHAHCTCDCASHKGPVEQSGLMLAAGWNWRRS